MRPEMRCDKDISRQVRSGNDSAVPRVRSTLDRALGVWPEVEADRNVEGTTMRNGGDLMWWSAVAVATAAMCAVVYLMGGSE